MLQRLSELAVRFSVFEKHAPVCIAFSGGMDSTVLLHAAVSLKWPIQVLHVNHQLQAQADEWELYCAEVAQRLSVPFVSFKVDVLAAGLGQEAAARTARYKALLAWMALHGHQVLLTAHHQDDQLETVLIQLFRGSGLRGLAGMKTWGPVGVCRAMYPNQKIFRPLLHVPRSEIAAYASLHQLDFVEDPSNQSAVHARNWLRNHFLPELLTRFPQALTGIAGMATHFQAHFEQTDVQVVQQFDGLAHKGGIDLEKLAAYAPGSQLEFLRHWLATEGVRCGRRKLLELQRQLMLPQGGKRQVEKGWWIEVSRRCATVVLERNSSE